MLLFGSLKRKIMTISISVPPTLRFMLCDASWHFPPPRVLPRRHLPSLNLSDSSLWRHRLVGFPSVFCNSIVRIPSGLGRHRFFEEFDSLSSCGLRDISLNNTIITKLYSLKAELWSRELVARRVPQRNVLSRDERIFSGSGDDDRSADPCGAGLATGPPGDTRGK